MKPKIKKIAVLTSGGDSPGMNAAIRAVVRTGIYYGLKVISIKRGYEGLIDGEFMEMNSLSVSNIIQRGGTILKTARSKNFLTLSGRKRAYENLKKHKIDSMVVLGGDGTFRGALEFDKNFDFPIVGIPCTIDNDLFGTDFCIGYDTAINTAVDAIDKIRDTADSHDRLFFIEVMGRDAGFIALRSGIAGGAEAILVPETKTSIDKVINILEHGWSRKKTSMIIVIAEGDEEGGALNIAKKVKEKFNQFDTRITILGHIQRGGKPTCMDRVLASRLGVAAVEALLSGKKNMMIGSQNQDITYIPFKKAVKHHLDINLNLMRIAEILAS